MKCVCMFSYTQKHPFYNTQKIINNFIDYIFAEYRLEFLIWVFVTEIFLFYYKIIHKIYASITLTEYIH
jgi:hypothetical protein